MFLPQYSVDPAGYLDAPPHYSETQPSGLSLAAGSYCDHPVTMIMKGQHRSPDLTLHLPGGDQLYHFSTDSTLVSHETFVKDLVRNRGVFTIKRKSIDDLWRYTIHTPGREGQKLLEVDTKSKLVSGSSIRLIFRNSATSELDELIMSTEGGSLHREVLYKGKKVAEVIDTNSRDPEYHLHLHRAHLDPLLVMILAYVVDDRSMTTRRRNRRPITAGLAGIGKGPGAGLAGAFALGSI